jgi:hypothetical protein
MYARAVPFREKWLEAMGYMEADLAAGYPKVWLELQALGWNRPELRSRVAGVNEGWRNVLRDAFAEARDEYGLTEEQLPLEAVVTLVMTFTQGLEVERLSGITTGHAELVEWLNNWILVLERGREVRDGDDHQRS